MTMLPVPHNHNLSKPQSYDYETTCGGGSLMSRVQVEGYYGQNICKQSEFGSDMGENNESRSNSGTGSVGGCGSRGNQNQQEQEKDEGWLQLTIGCRQSRGEREQSASTSLVELDLLPPPPAPEPCRHLPPPPLFNFSYPPPPPPSNLLFQQHQAPTVPIPNWAFAPSLPFTMPSSSSSPSRLRSHLAPSYFPTPFHFPPAFDDAAAGPSCDVRVVDPPRRPHSGIWFMLQASPNQAKEPFLPQIPKSYLRIKDGRMTVRLLLKYLVNKLRLHSESEIEIRCRGQQLVPFLTLEHVRDNIWSPRDAAMTSSTLLSDSSTSITDHIMVLHYGRCA